MGAPSTATVPAQSLSRRLLPETRMQAATSAQNANGSGDFRPKHECKRRLPPKTRMQTATATQNTSNRGAYTLKTLIKHYPSSSLLQLPLTLSRTKLGRSAAHFSLATTTPHSNIYKYGIESMPIRFINNCAKINNGHCDCIWR